MTRTSRLTLALLMATLGLGVSATIHGAESVPEPTDREPFMRHDVPSNDPRLNKLLNSFDRRLSRVGEAVLEAQNLLKIKKYQEALAKLHELDAVAGKKTDEVFVIERTRVAIAFAMDNQEVLVKSLEAVIATNQLDKTEQINFIEALADSYYRQKNYPQAATWLSRYFKEGGSDPAMRKMLVKSYYLNNDFAHAAETVRSDIQADESAARTPSESQLRQLLDITQKLNNDADYGSTLEKTVSYYPKKEYWAKLLDKVSSKPGFSDYLSFDVYRLMLVTGQLNTSRELTDMAQLALRAGYPGEARNIVDQGYQAAVLGLGDEAAAHNKLRDQITKAVSAESKSFAKDEAAVTQTKAGDGLVSLGYAHVLSGQFDKGIGLMEQGILTGNLKRPEDAKLHLAIANVLAGRKEKAIQTFKTVQGADGSADLARYWVLYLNHGSH